MRYSWYCTYEKRQKYLCDEWYVISFIDFLCTIRRAEGGTPGARGGMGRSGWRWPF